MTDQADYKQTRLEHASPDILARMLHQAQQQLDRHDRAACDTHQAKDKRDRAAANAAECRDYIRRIQIEAQRRIELDQANRKQAEEAKHLALALKPYEQEELTDRKKDKVFRELVKLEDDLTRAKFSEFQFQQQAKRAKTEADRIRNETLAIYWKKRSENAESRINEWLVMHQDDAYKPWLETDQDAPEILH